MAYDPIDGQVLLFGGLSRNRSDGDTWVFGNNHWTNLTPNLTLSPPPRYKGGLVYDSEDNEMLLFGGHSGAGYRNDTWSFDGAAWHSVPSTLSPGPREDVAMADDPMDHYVLLFGGEAPSGQLTDDTWTFTGGQWTNITTAVALAPPAREAGGLTYDGADQYVLLFSGKHGTNSLFRDTWSYTGGVWTNRTLNLTVSPPVREEMSLTYDFVDGFVLLFGGFHFPNSLADEWTYVNGTWSPEFPASLPPARLDAPVAYYPGQGFGFVLLFGGRSSPLPNATLYADTWSYKVPITVSVAASDQFIDLGEATQLSLTASGGYPPYVSYSWQGLPGPCSAGSVTNLSCTPGTNGTFPIFALATDSGGFNGSSGPFVLRVNADPSVSAAASTYVGEAVLPVDFTATVLGGTAPFQYAWDFGDGGTDISAAPSHNYTTGGSFTSTLTITDARGFNASTFLAPIVVTMPPAPLAATISASRTAGATPLLVQFTVNPTGGIGAYTFAWNLGAGGATSTGPTPAYTYTTVGIYHVTVVVTDAALGTVTAGVTIQALPPVPLAASASSDTMLGMAPLQVTFSAGANGGTGPYQYLWDFEPGAPTASGNNQMHTYYVAGNFTPTVTVTDANGTTSSSSVTLVVLPALAVSFVATVGTPYCSQGNGIALVTVNASASGGVGADTFAWSFPNGTAVGANATTLVDAGGIPSIQVTATDAQSHSSSTTQPVTVPSVSCATGAAGALAGGGWLVFVLIALVSAIIVAELAVLFRRRKD